MGMTRPILSPRAGAAIALSLPLGGRGSDIMHIDDLELGLAEDGGQSLLRGSFRVTDPGDCQEEPLGCGYTPWTVQVYVLRVEPDTRLVDMEADVRFHQAEVLDVRHSRVHFEVLLPGAPAAGAHRVGVFVENDALDNSNHLSAVITQA